jgi:pimeloyl-ACP methyl ester carboxylesterase
VNRFRTPDGLNLAWQEEGAGLPLLCLPGLTRNGADFNELADALGGRCRLIRLTLRGRGASDRDPDWTRYAVPVEAADVIAFLDHLGLDRVTIVGTSRGGLIAMVLAAMAKPRLAGVLLNDIGPELAPEGLAAIMGYLGVTPRAKTWAEGADALERRMGVAFPGLSREKWLSLARRWFDETPDGLALNYDPRIRDALAAGMEQPPGQPPADLWPLFDALAGVPLAVVRRETVEKMRARRPDLIVAEVPDRGHVPFLDEPEALAALETLLARVEA